MTSFGGHITYKSGYTAAMLEAVFGSLAAERVLLVRHRYEQAYGRQIAVVFRSSGVSDGRDKSGIFSHG